MRFWSRLRALWSSDSPSLIAIANIAASSLALISAPIIARSIGPAGRGETAAAIAVFSIAPVLLALGTSLEIRRVAAMTDGTVVIRTARIFWPLATIPAIAVALVLNSTIFAGFPFTERIIIFIGVAATPIAMSWMGRLGVLVAQGRNRGVFLLRLAQPIVYVALIVIGWILGLASVAYVLAASLLGTLVTAILASVLVRVPLRGPRSSPRALIRRGLTFAGGSIAEVASSQLPLLLALPLTGSYETGIYAVAAVFGTVPLAVGHSVSASYFREIAREPDEFARRELREQAVRSSIALGIVVCGLLCALAPFVVPIVFGHDFSPAVPVTLVVLVGGVAILTGFVASMTLVAEARGARATVAQLVSLVSLLVLLVVLAPEYGAFGSALSSSTASFILVVMLLASMRVRVRKLFPTPRDFVVGFDRLFRKTT